jgi:ribonuclease Z
MRITFLGTSAGTPTRSRNVTSQALTFEHGGLWLLDCGEATQHQLLRSNLKPSHCERILITHLHGDHCYGLPGLLSCIAIHGRLEPVSLVGPPGVRELVETVLRLSEAALPYRIDFTELPAAGGQVPSLHGWQVSAHPLVHRVTCLGYVLQEEPLPGRFHPERARAAGIPEGRAWGRLQAGTDITLDDGTVIAASSICDPPRPGRKIVLLGDTSDAAAIVAPGADCDLLVCETTYEAAHEAKAVAWGHMTTSMTGALADRMAAKRLIITHFSSRYTTDAEADTRSIADLVAETAHRCPHTAVSAADDLTAFTVARR